MLVALFAPPVCHPKGENGAYAVWLRLKRIRIKSGGVIGHFEVVKPFEVVEHEPGAKTDGAPFFEVMVYAGRFLSEFAAGTIGVAVIAQILDADFKNHGLAF